MSRRRSRSREGEANRGDVVMAWSYPMNRKPNRRKERGNEGQAMRRNEQTGRIGGNREEASKDRDAT